MAHAHEDSGRGRTAKVHVVTVSTTRTDATDRSGPLARQLLMDAGHAVPSRELVPDDPTAIAECLDRAIEDVGVDVVLFTGGTGISARDCTPRVVRGRLDREIPGFGELFRHLSYAEIGAAAMLSDAVAGIIRGKVVFAVPGSSGGCRLALEKLILPELGHIFAELGKEGPLARAPARAPGGVVPVVRSPASRVAMTSVPRVMDGADTKEPTRTIFEVVMETMGAVRVPNRMCELPSELSGLAAVAEVLDSAGDRVALRFEDGSEGAAFGFPDLTRPSAKVLVVHAGEPFGEIVAAHRGLQGTGVCAVGAPTGVLPDAEDSLLDVTRSRTRMPYDGPGRVFAVEVGLVYYLEGGRVFRWDGRASTLLGTPAQALASLLLAWSQR